MSRVLPLINDSYGAFTAYHEGQLSVLGGRLPNSASGRRLPSSKAAGFDQTSQPATIKPGTTWLRIGVLRAQKDREDS